MNLREWIELLVFWVKIYKNRVLAKGKMTYYQYKIIRKRSNYTRLTNDTHLKMKTYMIHLKVHNYLGSHDPGPVVKKILLPLHRHHNNQLDLHGSHKKSLDMGRTLLNSLREPPQVVMPFTNCELCHSLVEDLWPRTCHHFLGFLKAKARKIPG